MAAPSESRIKGISFRTFLQSLERLKGAEAVSATLALLPEDLRQKLASGVIFTGSWYPLTWYQELHAASQRATGGGLELARQIGFQNIKSDLDGVYRIFVAVMSPAFIMARSAALFHQYHDPGDMEIVESGDNFARARWSHCGGFNRSGWENVIGAVEAALAAVGVKDVVTERVQGGNDGDDAMELIARWR